MPTNLILHTEKFDGMDNILASEIGLRSPRMLTIDTSFFTVEEGQDIILAPGTIIAKFFEGQGRAYAAAKATDRTTTAQDTVTVDNVQNYKVGDELSTATGALGTIQSIDPKTNIITLAANSTTAVADGDVVTVSGPILSKGDPYGIIISTINLSKTSNDVAVYTSASVYQARMPHWTPELQAQLPEITLVGPPDPNAGASVE